MNAIQDHSANAADVAMANIRQKIASMAHIQEAVRGGLIDEILSDIAALTATTEPVEPKVEAVMVSRAITATPYAHTPWVTAWMTDALRSVGAPDMLAALQAEQEWREREEAGALDPEWDYESMVGNLRRSALSKATAAA